MASVGARTYRAGTLREALAQVRRDLGGGAVILGTREVRRRRLFGLRARELVEVTASDRAPEPPAPAFVAPTVTIPESNLSDLEARFGERLGRLHAMVAEISRAGRVEHLLTDVPSPLVPTYSGLIEADVPEALARRIVVDVADRIEPDDLYRPEAIRAEAAESVGDCLAIAPPIAAVAGSRRVVALVGPTGVGKTTTVAKLAADSKLVQGLRPGLVTVDTYRIAAVEQLRTYAEIIDLPLAVVSAPADMKGAIEGLGDVDLVLIDTAGRSPRDEVKIRELAEFLAAAGPDEVHLVLSASAAEKGLRSAVERFASVHADRLILTKLDEAEGLGGVFAALVAANRPVSYLTTGQAVPDDIERADRGRLARLILGYEAIGGSS